MSEDSGLASVNLEQYTPEQKADFEERRKVQRYRAFKVAAKIKSAKVVAEELSYEVDAKVVAGLISQDQGKFLKGFLHEYEVASRDTDRQKALLAYGQSMGYFTQKVAIEQRTPPDTIAEDIARSLRHAGLMPEESLPDAS